MDKDSTPHIFLADILERIYNDSFKLFYSLGLNPEADSLQIILVSYRETTDSIVFWDLYPHDEDKVKLISKMNIRNGEGSVGFTLRSKQPEIVNNTFDDPRGSVASVDHFIGNISWFGIPIFHDNEKSNDIKFIISFSYNKENFWEPIIAKKIKHYTEKKIKKYSRELELLNEIQINKNIQNIFLDGTSDNQTLIERISKVVDETTSYSYILYKQDNLIKQIKLNESIVENRISKFLNWCELFSNKCSNCPVPTSIHDKNNCKYYSDFLKYLEPYEYCEIPIDNDYDFVLKLYCIYDEENKILIDNDEFITLFNPILNIYKTKASEAFQKKIIVDIIHQIVDHFITFLKNNNESKTDEDIFPKYNQIIFKFFKINNLLDYKNFKNIFLNLKDKIKNRLLIIELWQNNIDGINIQSIKQGEKMYYNGIDTLIIKDNLLREPGTTQVLIRKDLIPFRSNQKEIKYKPLISSLEGRAIYKKGNKYFVEENKKVLYEIEWQETNNLSQLIGIKLSPLNIEKYLKNFIFINGDSSLAKNQFFKFEKQISFKSDNSERNFEIILALKSDIDEDTHKIIDEDTHLIIKRFCKIVYESEYKQMANTRAAISQVMARNMSHNIGSHVLSKLLKDEQIKKIYFKNKDGEKVSNNNEIQSILTNDKVFYQCLNALKDIEIEGSGKILKEDKETNESLLATFFNYLKARMDFLADVTTSTPVIENIRGFYNDMIKPFIQNRVLNDRISGIDTFNYELIACKPDCTKNNGKNCKDIETKDNCLCKLCDTTDLQVSIPNDVLGIQAFYTILENIIRNTAKHGNTPVKKEEKDKEVRVPFEFKIKVEEANTIFTDIDNPKGIDLDEYYAISIFDNCDLSEEETIDIDKVSENDKDEIRKKQCYQEKISEGKIKKIDKLVIDQNHILNKSILENNQLRHGGWGLIEMDASAAYMRKIPVELIDSDDYEINDLHGKCPVSEGNKLCIYQAYSEQGKYLGYRFFVYKPREILVIGDVDKLLANGKDKVAKLKELKNKGIWMKSKDEIKKDIEDKVVFPHRLIVITDNIEEELCNSIENNPCFSKRILKRVNIKTINFNSIESIWKLYYRIEGSNTNPYTGNDRSTSCAFDYHGKDYCNNIINNIFVEISYSATLHLFDVEKEKVLNRNFSWPLKIVVIDERIQHFALNEKYHIEGSKDDCSQHSNGDTCYHESGVSYSDLYKNTNILVPNKDNCNLNEQNFYEQTPAELKKILKYIQNNFVKKIESDSKKNEKDSSFEKTEFLVIHLGVIEKLITAWNEKKQAKETSYDKEKNDQVGEFIKNVILKLNNKNEELTKTLYDKVIVTSGRGKPHNLPDDIRYINFSVISQYMITQRNKYAFTEALYSARKTFKTN